MFFAVLLEVHQNLNGQCSLGLSLIVAEYSRNTPLKVEKNYSRWLHKEESFMKYSKNNLLLFHAVTF